MIRGLVLVLVLASGPAWASTFHVRTQGSDACAGTANANGTTGACAKRTIRGAIAVASAGDTIVVHGGTYADSSSVSVDGYPAMSYNVHVTKPGLTIVEAPGESATLSGASGVNGCVLVEAKGLTWDGIDCTGHVCGTEGNRTGIFYNFRSGGTRLRNAKIDGAKPLGSGEFSCGGVRIGGKGSDDIIVEGMTLTGYLGHAVFIEFTSGPSGIVVRNNTIAHAWRGGDDTGYAFTVKQSTTTGPIAIYANRVTQPTGPTAMYLREFSSPLYVFNNVFVNALSGFYGLLYSQDNTCPYYLQNVNIFNNTATGTKLGMAWQSYFSAMRVKNNIFDGPAHALRGYDSGNDCGTHAELADQRWSAATDKFTNNIVEHSSGGMFYRATPSPEGNVSTAGTVRTEQAQTSRDGLQNLRASTGVATNDPLGQGPNVCSIAAAGQTINCSRDINGDDRTATWDCGADQYQVIAAPGVR